MTKGKAGYSLLNQTQNEFYLTCLVEEVKKNRDPEESVHLGVS
jgi:hypothetical protein